MTEAEWLAETDPHPMLRFLGNETSERKVRLLACGCCRRTWHLLRDVRSQRAVETAERMADGKADLEEILSALSESHQAWLQLKACHESLATAAKDVLAVAGMETEHTWLHARGSAVRCLHHAISCVAAEVGSAAHDEQTDVEAACAAFTEAARIEESCQTLLVHDVFGNPFQPITVDPSWLTSTVLALATGIYEDRAFDRFPILADALMDAGCSQDDLLNHLRTDGPHIRGCWALDLVLGKS